VKENVSEYAGSKAIEATAELVALYTHRNYKRGTLAAPLEAVLDKRLKKSAVSKSLADGDEFDPAEVFVSVSPEAPPPGYTLVSADGPDIRFRAPDGSIVQFVDMVAQGLFGPEDSDEEEG
jgi:hypothetical protein